MPIRLPALAAMLALLALPWPALPRGDLSAEDQARVAAVTRPTQDFSKAEPFEVMQGGAGTVDKLINADIFSHPAANLDFEGRQEFMVGNGLFRKDWVSSPSSTLASDGLGPLFNARSCQACHVKDGRGSLPAFDALQPSEAMALLLKLARPAGGAAAAGGSDSPDPAGAAKAMGSPGASGSQDAMRGDSAVGNPFDVSWLPDPVYGAQFQPFAVPGLPAEGKLRIDYTEQAVALQGGETVMLRQPRYRLEELGYGPLHPDTRWSPRLAPPMLGMGLLEAIAEADIVANAERPKPDGVRGRPHWLPAPGEGEGEGARILGRFNWKASQPDVMHQAAAAFSGDMGLSSPLFPDHHGDCTAAQTACRELPHGAQPHLGEHEVPARLMDFVEVYSQNIGLPRRRDADDARVLAGKKLFYDAQCVACHVPKYVTRRDAKRPEHRFQLIWPYTDLLLHDMGPGLADEVRDGEASGSEWRTPPLWGIGLTRTVNPDATWLHDGRARTLLEAVLWHGGEAQPSRDRVVDMTPQDRADLIRFLESL